MNAGHDKAKARQQAQANANYTGTTRYLHWWGGCYWIDKSKPKDAIWPVETILPTGDCPFCAAAPEMAEALRELTEAASVMFCNLASLNERDRQLAADCYWDSTEKARAALQKAGVL